MARRQPPTEPKGPQPWYDAFFGAWGGPWPTSSKEVDATGQREIRRILEHVKAIEEGQRKAHPDGYSQYDAAMAKNRRDFMRMLETLLYGKPITTEQEALLP